MADPFINWDESYNEWLYKKYLIALKSEDSPAEQLRLFDTMMRFPFDWYIPNDDNRAKDGMELRDGYTYETGKITEFEIFNSNGDSTCSYLEFIIGLANRAAFISIEVDESIRWVWMFIENTFGVYWKDQTISQLQFGMDRIITRKYHRNGDGGLFPLPEKHPKDDQTKLELWYQLNRFIIQNNL